MFKYNDTIYAGINTAEEFATWLESGKPDTGYTFIRNLDNFDMGPYIHLGMDYSEVHHGLAKQPRVDKPEYYTEVKHE